MVVSSAASVVACMHVKHARCTVPQVGCVDLIGQNVMCSHNSALNVAKNPLHVLMNELSNIIIVKLLLFRMSFMIMMMMIMMMITVVLFLTLQHPVADQGTTWPQLV